MEKEYKGKMQGAFDFLQDESLNFITTRTLAKYIDVKVKIAEEVFGYNSLGHKEALMAQEMFKQVMLYVHEYEITDVTFEKIHDRLKQEVEEQ